MAAIKSKNGGNQLSPFHVLFWRPPETARRINAVWERRTLQSRGVQQTFACHHAMCIPSATWDHPKHGGIPVYIIGRLHVHRLQVGSESLKKSFGTSCSTVITCSYRDAIYMAKSCFFQDMFAMFIYPGFGNSAKTTVHAGMYNELEAVLRSQARPFASRALTTIPYSTKLECFFFFSDPRSPSSPLSRPSHSTFLPVPSPP